MNEEFEKNFKIMQMENMLANEKEYHKWQEEIPNISFPSDWEIRIIPPFGGAIVRFLAIKGDRQVSVYLDCYDRLGIYGSPYWEIYPNTSGDVDRLSMNDVDGLLQGIKESLEYKEA